MTRVTQILVRGGRFSGASAMTGVGRSGSDDGGEHMHSFSVLGVNWRESGSRGLRRELGGNGRFQIWRFLCGDAKFEELCGRVDRP